MENWERFTRRRPPTSPTTGYEPAVCEIRVLDSVAELLESYRLRYAVYGALHYIQHTNASRLEVDEFDTSSIPFGAFDPASGAMIGTLRLVGQAPHPDYQILVQQALACFDDPALIRLAVGPRPHPLPSLISDGIARQIAAFNTGRFPVHELSRTIVRPDHRGTGVSRGLMEFGLAHAARDEEAVLIGSCLPEHTPMYARYGYVQPPQGGLDYFDSVGRLANAVVCRTDVLPEPTRDHVDELRAAMKAGASEHTLEIGRASRARFRLATRRFHRRRTME
jgi:predicted GNAT family N-acyltransferase